MSGLVCAFCLSTLEIPQTVIRCSECTVRVYCSEDCRHNDFGLVPASEKRRLETAAGQAHGHWCALYAIQDSKHGIGSEGRDWEVAQINPHVGLGIVALQPIGRGMRVAVDSLQRRFDSCTAHLTAPLHPLHASLREKLRTNAVGCADSTLSHSDPHSDDSQLAYALAPRLSRANHDCNPNAGRCHDPYTDTLVMYARRDIQQGEEIRIDYMPWTSAMFEAQISPHARRQELMDHWGITCPSDCYCYQRNVQQVVMEAAQLDKHILFLSASIPQSFSRRMTFLAAIDEMLDLIRDHCPPVSQADYLWNGFCIAIMDKANVPRGVEYLRKLEAVKAAIFHPSDRELLHFQSLLRDPSIHEDYLLYEVDRSG
ncbi:hypothetical protein HDU78_008171 [Chytriomyces hyalinus]|nr:hypothetical protein HDU78_008171 [Chytriomyces hyalinus]